MKPFRHPGSFKAKLIAASVTLAAATAALAAGGGAEWSPFASTTATLPAALQGRGPVTPYTLVQRQTDTPVDGQSFLRAEKRRYQRSDGLFAVAHTYYRRDGSVEAVVHGLGVLGVGAYRHDEGAGRLEFIAPLSAEAPTATEAQLRADPGFDRVETVSGQRALVARYDGADSQRSREIWRAPALQNFELKTVEATPRGVEVIEPTELQLGEPDAAPFQRAAHLPRSYARFEERIREAERRGEAGLAARLRQDLDRARR